MVKGGYIEFPNGHRVILEPAAESERGQAGPRQESAGSSSPPIRLAQFGKVCFTATNGGNRWHFWSHRLNFDAQSTCATCRFSHSGCLI